jgi:4-hydroxythreonine-4-phosphate dehydrogenase
VTGPIAKKKVRDCGFLHAGQTEFLGHFFKTKHVEMVFVSKPLKVVLVTRHMALKDAVSAIKKRRIVTCGRLVCDLLKKNFRIKSPKIAVCGLNPHAGEGGLFGLEEKLEIAPAIRQLNKILGNYFYGPFPADTIFSRALRSEFDMVMAMYHDQGLIPFKVAEFEQGVNLTAGLPFIRTSPVHGTAFDIAGKNLADHRSMQSAIELAYQLTQ